MYLDSEGVIKRIKRTVNYKKGYKIVITDKFYEVMDGKAVLHFGQLRHKPTVQEVWNKTLGLKTEEELEKQRASQDRQMGNIKNRFRNNRGSSADNLLLMEE